jgi:hypothetical protein
MQHGKIYSQYCANATSFVARCVTAREVAGGKEKKKWEAARLESSADASKKSEFRLSLYGSTALR